MSTELSIVRPENVQLIAQNAPTIYNDNKQRMARCDDFGKVLLAEIQRTGMSDELDQRCATYIEKARKTVKLMNEQRSPITKLFDQIRAEFTGMENSIDATKTGSIPAQIQAFRNQYAAHKREEEERRRREEMLKLQKEQAKTKYEQDVEDEYIKRYTIYSEQCINELTALNAALTLDNFDAQAAKITAFPAEAPADLFARIEALAPLFSTPQLLTSTEAAQIREQVKSRLQSRFTEQYAWEIGDLKNSIADALPSKRKELEKMAQANAEEQERMKAELAAKEAAEAARLEVERKRKAEEEAAAKQMQAQAQQMGDLFAAASVQAPGYAPKTQVKKRVTALDAEGIISIISYWWSKEGQFLPVDELTKMFKRQITAVEKYANDKSNPEFISSTHVLYEDEVKAK